MSHLHISKAVFLMSCQHIAVVIGSLIVCSIDGFAYSHLIILSKINEIRCIYYFSCRNQKGCCVRRLNCGKPLSGVYTAFVPSSSIWNSSPKSSLVMAQVNCGVT